MKELLAAWVQAKEKESEAQRARIELEGQIFDLVDKKADGSKTTTIEGYKVTVTTGTTSKVLDWDKFIEICDQLPEEQQPYKLKPELETKGMAWLSESYPAIYRALAKIIETKPKKPGFKIVEVN